MGATIDLIILIIKSMDVTYGIEAIISYIVYLAVLPGEIFLTIRHNHPL